METGAEASVQGRILEKACRMPSPSSCGTETELHQLIDLLEKKAGSLGVCPETVQKLRSIVEQGLQAIEQQFQAERLASDRLLAHVSHELRTPLTPALLSVCLLQRDRTLAPGIQDELATIRRNIEQEARLIDNLIDHASFTQLTGTGPGSQLRIA